MIKNKIFVTSRFGVITVLLFILFSLMYRILLPFGDEPDFRVRTFYLITNEHNWFSPYYWVAPILKKLSTSLNCVISADPLSLWAKIYSPRCSESLTQILLRFSTTMFVVSPLLLVSIFRRRFYLIINTIGIKFTFLDLSKRLDILGLSLMLPGMLYYLGLLTHEQFTLVLSLFIFIFWGKIIIVTGLLMLISISDLGNAVVVFAFICLAYSFLWIIRRFGLKVGILAMITLVIASLIVGYTALQFFEKISFLAEKTRQMENQGALGGYRDKYPLLLRPIITFLTATFMTPSGIKVVLVNAMLGIGFIYSCVRIYKEYFVKKFLWQYNFEINFLIFQNEIILAMSALTTIVCFVYLFPEYGNAKYYMFLVPFIITPIIQIISKLKFLRFLVSCSSLVVITLFMYHF